MNRENILPAVSAALAADEFAPTVTAGGVHFLGSVKVRGREVRLRLEYRDLQFADPPYVFVENPEVLPRPVIPHLDEVNELCVVDRRRFVADRHHAPAEARGLLVRTIEVLERGLTRHAVSDIAAEFPQHWGGSLVAVTFGRYAGLVEVAADGVGNLVLKPCEKGTPAGVAVRTSIRLSFTDTQSRPKTLDEVLAWAAAWDTGLADRILKGLAGLSPVDPLCIIVAPNGTVGFSLLVSSRGKAQVAALSRPNGWRRALQTRAIRALRIQRHFGRRGDLAYALGRNGGGVPPLSGKDIVLVGCGSIGGFLARTLAQLGAGFGDGRLILIDDDTLSVPNLGRHILGAADAGKTKVDGCRALIERDFPGAKVLARAQRVQDQRSLVGRADLVIDATGEQAISEMINAWMLEARAQAEAFPAVLYGWIEGAGAAAQSYVGSDPEFGCFRCLRPEHAERPRYSALKDDAKFELEGACGELAFTPYGPSAPMMAAALITQHAVDWVSDKARPLLRTNRVDWGLTKEVKPVNPPRSDRCPACR